MTPPPSSLPNQSDQQQQQLNNIHPTTNPTTTAPWTETSTATSASASASASANTPPRSTPRIMARYDTSTPSSQPFDETRRGLQARGKNYNMAGASSTKGGKDVGSVGHAKQYEERQKRDEAVAVLESEEMIMWIAASRNEV
ncbi:fructose-26-bisphosphatase [Pyrenophora seminiperda CCB06]|uniref:Fructose-26-bisphosphatase n=1 Tax=Pyrenophora seminiperda CCB06 TaxID=1302712 RepID=A0A3M7M9K0_9PLEO|nr:fructose-26-bisphosphatase [Pyrenophora seminiperda CCB06]